MKADHTHTQDPSFTPKYFPSRKVPVCPQKPHEDVHKEHRTHRTATTENSPNTHQYWNHTVYDAVFTKKESIPFGSENEQTTRPCDSVSKPPKQKTEAGHRRHTAHNCVCIKNVQQATPRDAARGGSGLAWAGAGAVAAQPPEAGFGLF